MVDSGNNIRTSTIIGRIIQHRQVKIFINNQKLYCISSRLEYEKRNERKGART